MKFAHLSARLYGVPHLINAEKLGVLDRVLQSYVAGHPVYREAPLEPVPPRPQSIALAAPRFADKPYTVTEGGIAVLSAVGTLVQRGDSLDASSGLIGYNRLESLGLRAAADPDVRGILFEWDTPGGDASGCFDLADLIKKWGAVKPVWAAINEIATSAGYVLAAPAARIAMARTGLTGSIGVVTMFVDQSARDKSQGYAYTYIYAGEHKVDGNPHQPLTDAVTADIQARIDYLYDLFCAHVSTCRPISDKAVRAQQAATYSAPDALRLKMIDAIEPFNETLAAFEQYVSQPQQIVSLPGLTAQSQTNPSTMEGQMPDTTQPTGSPVTHDLATLQATARTQERARIQAITTHPEAQGRGALAAHLAYSTDMTPEQAAGLLAAAPREQAAAPAPATPPSPPAPPAPSADAQVLREAMARIPNPDIRPGGGAEPGAKTDDQAAEAMAADVLKILDQASGRKGA